MSVIKSAISYLKHQSQQCASFAKKDAMPTMKKWTTASSLFAPISALSRKSEKKEKNWVLGVSFLLAAQETQTTA
jgi:hypothetical protein